MPDPKSTGDSWSSDNLSDSVTWLLLAQYADLTAKFSDAKDVPMSKLAILNPTSSAEKQEEDAKNFAAILDRKYRSEFGATFQKDWSKPKAVDALTTILKDKDKTVGDVGAKVREIYNFQ